MERHVDLANAEWFALKTNVKDAASDLAVYLSLFELAQYKRLQEPATRNGAFQLDMANPTWK